MKKIISVLITLSVMLSMTVFPVEAESTYDENKYNLLVALDVIDEADYVDIADDKITRSDYIIYLMRLFGRDGEQYIGNSLFSDLKVNDECYDAASIAKEMGWYPDLEFNPREDMCYGDAVKIIQRAMGYADRFTSNTLSYPASSLDLPSIAKEKEMTINDMTELFYSAIHEPLLLFNIVSDSSLSVNISKENTILSKYRNIEVITGTVTSNSVTSIYSDALFASGGIEIDEVYYRDENDIGRDYLGYNVRAYMDYTDDEDEGNLIYITEYRTDVILIDSSEIQNVNDRVTQITYTPSERRLKTAKIDVNAKIIYNGKFFGDYTKNDIMPENGSVKLIDNNRDGTADVVIVWSYVSMFVDNVSLPYKKIYNGYKTNTALMELCLDEDEVELYDIILDGNEISFSDIQRYQILSVAKSKDVSNGYVRIEVSNTQIKGKVEAIDRTEAELKIDGEYYSMLPEFMNEYNNILLTNSYVFYIDAFGNVAAMTVDNEESSFIYAYLYKAVAYDSDDAAALKVFTQDADWMKFEINKEIRYNGKKVTPYELINGVPRDERRRGLVEGGTTNRQVIKIKTDGNSITSLETAGSGSEIGEFNCFRENIAYRYQNLSFDNKYFLGDDTIILGIPSDDPDNLDAYILNPVLAGDKLYSVSAYTLDEYGFPDIITIDVPTFRKNIQTCLVLRTKVAIDKDGMPCTVLRCSFTNFGQYDIEVSNTVNIDSLNRGDIIDITVNEIGQIISYSKKYDYNIDGKTYYYPSTFHSNAFLRGRIVKVDPENERMIVNFGGERTSQTLRLTYADLNIKRYNESSKTAQVVSAYALVPGDFVVIDHRASIVREVIVYEE